MTWNTFLLTVAYLYGGCVLAYVSDVVGGRLGRLLTWAPTSNARKFLLATMALFWPLYILALMPKWIWVMLKLSGTLLWAFAIGARDVSLGAADLIPRRPAKIKVPRAIVLTPTQKGG